MGNPTGRLDQYDAFSGLSKRKILEFAELSRSSTTPDSGRYIRFTTSGTGAPFTVTMQVTDSIATTDYTGYYPVNVRIGDTEWAASGTHAITLTVGTDTFEKRTDQWYELVTDANGTCTIEITTTADVYVSASVSGEYTSSGVLTYSAPGANTGESIGLLLALTYP